MNENQPTIDGFMPIARSMPCTGYGVNTSHFEKPASRTFSAACIASAGVSNSAIIPYVPEVGVISRRSSMMMSLGAAFRMMRVGLRRHCFNFRDGDQRYKPQEKQEHGKKQAEGSEIRANIHPGRAEVTPRRRQEVAVQRHDDDEAFEPHADVHQNREDPNEYQIVAHRLEPEKLRHQHVATDHDKVSPAIRSERAVNKREFF